MWFEFTLTVDNCCHQLITIILVKCIRLFECLTSLHHFIFPHYLLHEGSNSLAVKIWIWSEWTWKCRFKSTHHAVNVGAEILFHGVLLFICFID